MSSQDITFISSLHTTSMSIYRIGKNKRSRSKVKVTGVKSLIFGVHAISQKVFVRFSQYIQDRSSKIWDRSLFQNNLERSKAKVTVGVNVGCILDHPVRFCDSISKNFN